MLFLGSNNLSGLLPEAWGAPGAFARLRLFSALGNKLSGPLPESWGTNSSMPLLQDLVLMANELEGES